MWFFFIFLGFSFCGVNNRKWYPRLTLIYGIWNAICALWSDEKHWTGVKMAEFTITLDGYFKVLLSQLADWPKCPSSTIKSNSNKSKAPEVCFLISHTCRENRCALNFHYYDATVQYYLLIWKKWNYKLTYGCDIYDFLMLR